MTEDQYDLIVIGAGPGGYVAAIRAAQLGMRVACVEKDAAAGGTCLNVGCIPSKALLDSTERYAQLRAGLDEHGIRVGGLSFDLDRMMARKRKVVETLTRGVAALLRKNRVERLQGRARLLAPGRVAVQGDTAREIQGRKILIASGSEPIELADLPFDGKRVVSSTEALSFSSVPQRLLVLGAGAIGLELGSVWQRLGSEVVVVEMMDRILPGADRDVAFELQRILERQGMRFHLGTTAVGAEQTASGVKVRLRGPEGSPPQLEADAVLVAVGRRPYTRDLGLDAVGVETDEKGRIRVDEDYRTTSSGIYAIGDVIPGPMLAHKASEEGIAAVERMAGLPGHVNYAAIPNVVYVWPELAYVGWSEEEARRRGYEVRTGTFPFRANGRARCAGETEGLVKVVADRDTDDLLGIHVLGPHASELIAEAAVAKEFYASAEDLARAVHAHPTLAEALREAALDVSGSAIHK